MCMEGKQSKTLLECKLQAARGTVKLGIDDERLALLSLEPERVCANGRMIMELWRILSVSVNSDEVHKM